MQKVKFLVENHANIRFTTDYAVIVYIIQMVRFLIVTILQHSDVGEIKKTSTMHWSTGKVWKECLVI